MNVYVSLLDGLPVNSKLDVRLSKAEDKDALDKTVLSCDGNSSVFLLHLPRELTEKVASRFRDAADFYPTNPKRRLSRQSTWTPQASSTRPKVARLAMKFRHLEAGQSRQFLVYKMFKLQKVDDDDLPCTIYSVRQKHGNVFLKIQDCPEIASTALIQVADLDHRLNGWRTTKFIGKGSVTIAVNEELFPEEWTSVCGTIVFGGFAMKDAGVLHEICPMREGADIQALLPKDIDWRNTADEANNQEVNRDPWLNRLYRSSDIPDNASSTGLAQETTTQMENTAKSNNGNGLPLKQRKQDEWDERDEGVDWPSSTTAHSDSISNHPLPASSHQQPCRVVCPTMPVAVNTGGCTSQRYSVVHQPIVDIPGPSTQQMVSHMGESGSVTRCTVPAEASLTIGTGLPFVDEAVDKQGQSHPKNGHVPMAPVSARHRPEMTQTTVLRNQLTVDRQPDPSARRPTAEATRKPVSNNPRPRYNLPLKPVAPIRTPPASRVHPPSVNKSKMSNTTSKSSVLVEYLCTFYYEDRHLFENDVIWRIHSHQKFRKCLEMITKQFGCNAVRTAFYASFSNVEKQTYNRTKQDRHHEDETCSEIPSKKKQIPIIDLYEYQRRVVEETKQPGNFLVCSATNTGKTWIFAEVARRLLNNDQNARVVVVVPKKALTIQQADVFRRHGFSENGYHVGAFCGDTTSNRTKVLECSVVVITPERLLQHLRKKDLSFADIQLLILDEAHHTKGDSSYVSVMRCYHSLNSDKQAETKVLALTATPASGHRQKDITESFYNLLKWLKVPERHFVPVQEDDPGVMRRAPPAECWIVETDSRPEDEQFRSALSEFVGTALRGTLGSHLGLLGLSELNEIRMPSHVLMTKDDNQNGTFGQWRQKLLDKLQRFRTIEQYHRRDIEEAVMLICLMEDVTRQSWIVGYEKSLQNLGAVLREKDRLLPDVIKQCNQHEHGSVFEKIWRNWEESPYKNLLPLSAPVSGRAASEGCGSFPKFQKLVEVLTPYTTVDTFHGMVFVETRLGCQEICSMLQRSRLGQAMSFETVVGQSSKSSKLDTGYKSQNQGMSVSQLTEVINRFKEVGKKVLVATNVLAEGVDVPSCELVVLYNLPKSGVELTQSKGRARKNRAAVVIIIEGKSTDRKQLQRSMEEERSRKAMLQRNHRTCTTDNRMPTTPSPIF